MPLSTVAAVPARCCRLLEDPGGSICRCCLHGDGEEGSVDGPSGKGMATPMEHVLGGALSGCCTVSDAPLFQTPKEPLTQKSPLTGCCAVTDAAGFQTQQDVMMLQQQQQQLSKQTDQVTALVLSLTDSFLQSNNTGVNRPAAAAPETLTANLPASLPAPLYASFPAPLHASFPASLHASFLASLHASLPATLPASPPTSLPASLPAMPSATLSDSGACISLPLTATTFGTRGNVRKRPASAMDAQPLPLRATDQACSLQQQQANMLKPLIPAAVVAFLGGGSTIRVSDFAAVGVRKELQSWLEGAA
ncbi:unnamed protein product [Closterium sp. Naga37s-1]|nr:unnamed protein product [Closterium sp. Naga37s-1]